MRLYKYLEELEAQELEEDGMSHANVGGTSGADATPETNGLRKKCIKRRKKRLPIHREMPLPSVTIQQ